MDVRETCSCGASVEVRGASSMMVMAGEVDLFRTAHSHCRADAERLRAENELLTAALRKWEAVFPAHRAECAFLTERGCTCGLEYAHALTRALLERSES